MIVSLLAVAGGQNSGDKTVRLDTLGVQDTVYHLSDGGGNTLVFLDEDSAQPGVVLIDTKLPGWGETMLDTIGQITDLPVTTIINTHAHPDHAGSNGEFPTAMQIIAHENTKVNMARMEIYSGENAAGLPTTTFTDRFSAPRGLRPHRAVLLWTGAYRWRHRRRVSGEGRGLPWRVVSVEGDPDHRHRQWGQRSGVPRDPRQGGGRYPGCATP